MFANQDQWNKQKEQEQSGETWKPKQMQEEEGGSGGSGGRGNGLARPISDPWGVGGWRPPRNGGSPYGGFMYEPPKPILSAISYGEVGSQIPILSAKSSGVVGSQIDNSNADAPIPTPTPITPQPDQQQGNAFGTLNPMGFNAMQPNQPVSWIPQNQYGGIEYLPSKDWRAQGQVTFDQLAGLNKGFSQPEFNPIVAQPSSPAVANGFPDRVQPDPTLTAGVDSFTGAGGRKVNSGTPKVAAGNPTPGFAYLPFGGVPQPQPLPKPPLKLAPAKKSWGGYGGGGGGGGGYKQSWQDFLGNMNWKI